MWRPYIFPVSSLLSQELVSQAAVQDGADHVHRVVLILKRQVLT